MVKNESLLLIVDRSIKDYLTLTGLLIFLSNACRSRFPNQFDLLLLDYSERTLTSHTLKEGETILYKSTVPICWWIDRGISQFWKSARRDKWVAEERTTFRTRRLGIRRHTLPTAVIAPIGDECAITSYFKVAARHLRTNEIFPAFQKLVPIAYLIVMSTAVSASSAFGEMSGDPPRLLSALEGGITVQEGEPVHLDVRVASDSDVQITWLKDGNPILPGKQLALNISFNSRCQTVFINRFW